MDSLTSIFSRHSSESLDSGTDKGTLHSYVDIYSELLERYRTTARRVLEIGIAGGHSLLVWREYFPSAEIFGVDTTQPPDDIRRRQDMRILIGDATFPPTFDGVDDIDIVIDDGSYLLEEQVAAFEILWPRVSPGGLYIIEDVQHPEVSHATLQLLDKSLRIYDLRVIKRRIDDVLAVYRKPGEFPHAVV
jgi:trans-aconitate methyltransferase